VENARIRGTTQGRAKVKVVVKVGGMLGIDVGGVFLKTFGCV